MERVVGIGGYFLRAADPAGLRAWYRDCLGLDTDENGAWRGVQMLVLLPGFVLSGFLYPISSMPAIAQVLSRLFPVRPYLELLRGELLRGSGGERSLKLLAGFALVTLSAATALVRRARRAAA